MIFLRKKRFCKYGHDTFISGREKQGHCSDCSKKRYAANRNAVAILHQNYRLKNKEKLRLIDQQQYRAKATLLVELKNKPCMDCGIKYPSYVMDFDHRNGLEKVGAVGSLVARHHFKWVIEEIKKCDLVCANCHRIRTHKRRQYVSAN